MIKASPFLAAKAVKKKVKLAPPLAFGGAFLGATAAAPIVGAAGLTGSLGSIVPALAGLGGGGAAGAGALGQVVSAVPGLAPAFSAFGPLISAATG